jgi:hypothetical protein
MDWLGGTWLGKGAKWLGGKIGDGASWLGGKLGAGASWMGDKIGKGASWLGGKIGDGASWLGGKLGVGASWLGDKIGKGMDWLGGTWLGKGAKWLGGKIGDGASWLGDKVEGGLRWAGDKVGKGADWLSKSWLGKIGRGIYRPIAALTGGASHLINKGIGALEHGIDWVENKVGGAADWVAKKTAGIPVLGTMTQMGASFIKFQSQVTGGFLKGGLDFVGGLANMALHPVDTAKGLFHLAEHLPMIPGVPNPLKLAHNLYDVAAGNKRLKEALNDTFNPLKSGADDGKFLYQFGKAFLDPYIQAVKDGKPGEAVGRLGFDVLMLIGTDGAGAATRGTGEAVNALGRTEEGLRALSELQKTEEGARALSELQKGEQGAKAIEELQKTEQGQKALEEARKTEQGQKALGEGEQAGKAAEGPKAPSEEMPPGKKPSGSGHVEEIDPHAEKAYDAIRASKTDVAAVAKNTGIPESTLERIKNHLFVDEHEIATVAGQPPVKSRFVANQRWADLWEGAQKGTLKPAQKAELMDLLTHENVEATLSKKGLYIYEPEALGPGGEAVGRPFTAQGAHDLAGIAERNFRPDLVDKMPPAVRQQYLKDMIKASMEVRGDFPPEMLKNMHPEARQVYEQILSERNAMKGPTP